MESPTDSVSGPNEQEIRELLDFLRILTRALGFNDAALARKADIPLSTLLRAFKGETEPKIGLVFAIVRALGLSIREFFELAYPEEEEPSQARLQIERALGRVRTSRPKAKAPERPEGLISMEEVELILERARAEVQKKIEGRGEEESSRKKR
jgi:transcriptional regulator with XRE-family HTH domain